MKPKAGKNDSPSIAEDILSAKWNLSIMRVLGDGPARFSGIRAAIPTVSANILARRLRELEEAGILSRRALPPPADCRVYELTTRGEAARPVIGAIDLWESLFFQLGPLGANSQNNLPEK